MAGDSKKAIMWYIEQDERGIKEPTPYQVEPGGNGNTEKYEQPQESGGYGGLSSIFHVFSVKNTFKMLLRDFMGIIYSAAALCINTIRTFYLVILAILGPLVMGLSVFDSFKDSLASWFARYINIYLWLPVANIFSAICAKILENLFTLDQGFASSTAYIIFMVIAIVGYTTVPTVANYIVQAGGKDTLLHKINDMTRQGVASAATAAKSMFK